MNNLLYNKSLLSSLPAVHKIQKLPEVQEMISNLGNSLVLSKIREVQKDLREALTSENEINKIDIDIFLSNLRAKISEIDNDLLRPVFNLTGTVIHTNFGRSILPIKTLQDVKEIAESPSNLEYDVLKTKRGNRDNHISDMLCDITGAEACTIVNNNAAAVILVLNSLAKRKEVLVSRGELIEIGGSFRLPEIMTSANCKLKEVGTTNRTHIEDFESEIKKQTGLILKAHTSNFVIKGFTSNINHKDLAKLSKRHGLPFMVDLGSGSLIDLKLLGLPKESMPKEVLSNGADIITFSGDKLVGGPQCGIILGRKDLIDKINKNPLKRALRCDKMTIAAFASILKLYNDTETAIKEIPTLRMLNRKKKEIYDTAKRVFKDINNQLKTIANVEIVDCKSQIGSGSLPVELIPSCAIKISTNSNKYLSKLYTEFRKLPIPVIGRIHDNSILFDLRCLEDESQFLSQLKNLNLKLLKSK